MENQAPTLLSDIPFLGPGRTEKMDAYLPARRFPRPRPAVLLIHGGGWRGNDKADPREREIGHGLASEGFAVFSINYLLNQFTGPRENETLSRLAWPQNLTDCKSALRYLRHHHTRYGIDPAEFAVMGGSAGGSLALLVGLTAEVPALNAAGLYPEESNHVKCIINFYGVPDIVAHWTKSFAGPTEAETLANSRAASPSTYFSPDIPPILTAHGTADTIVPVETSRDLAARLSRLGARHTYLEVPDAPHTFAFKTAGIDLQPAVSAFLRQHLHVNDSVPPA